MAAPAKKKNNRKAAERFAAQNRKATHEFMIVERLEVGMVLTGTEVKSLRSGQASLAEAWAGPHQGEIFLFNCHIPEYKQAGAHLQHVPARPRALLLHKKERNKLIGAITREGMSLVPLSIYFNEKGRAKLALGLAKGKKKVDKRAAIKERDWARDKARLMRARG